jgi:hypothetical protein
VILHTDNTERASPQSTQRGKKPRWLAFFLTCHAVSHRRARGIPAAVAGGARVATVVSFMFEKGSPLITGDLPLNNVLFRVRLPKVGLYLTVVGFFCHRLA